MSRNREPKNTPLSFKKFLEQRIIERTVALRKSEGKYRLLVENTGTPILSFDRDGRLLFINQIGAQHFGGTPEALVGKSLQELFPQSQINEFLVRIQKVIDSGVGDQFEDNAPFPNGRRWFWLNLQPIKNELGKPIGVQLISQDITRRKEAEQELVRAKQIAEQLTRVKERFLAHISHEIRTPMNTVVGMAHLLQKTNPNPEQREYLEALQSASNNLLGIINHILDFSKIEAGMIEFVKVEFRLAEIMENVKQTIRHRAQEKNLALLISINDRIPVALIGDPVRLNQILMNLVDNAIKFTEKGAVIVHVELLEENDHNVKLSFSVRDNGIGIPADKLNLIFEDFTQASPEIMRTYGGSGLGLTIVKQLVEMQGGSISVESQVDKGSTFCFTLWFEKIATSAVQSGQTTAVNEPAMRLDGLRVFLVEDDKLSQRVAATMLGKWGATVEIAENGRMAIQKLTTNSYDIILMDVLTPEMDGYETTAYIRNEMNGTISRIPILAMTASASVKARKKVLACGMNDYITKPFDPDDLCTKIMRLVNKQKLSIE
jgi:PAS domain S-box-containing protein